MTDSRLTSARYLDLLHREGERLLVGAEGAMDQAVPACEGWTVADVVFHVGSVYSHKLTVLRLGRRPVEGEWAVPDDEATHGDDLAWCHMMLHTLAAELGRRAAGDRAWTWWEADQTVGFWQRRMAIETAVHRADVESASGPVTAIDVDLARDGIDELLVVMLAGTDLEAAFESAPGGQQVTVRLDGVTVVGGASAVLLWLWGRQPDEGIVVEGQDAAIADVRAVLRASTQ